MTAPTHLEIAAGFRQQADTEGLARLRARLLALMGRTA